MEYFIVKAKNVNGPKPVSIDQKDYPYLLSEKNFQNISPGRVDYYYLNPDTEPTQIMVNPTFMVGEELKHIMEVYDPAIQWKSLYLLPGEEQQLVEGTLHFWIPSMTKQKCLHEETKVLPNGAIDELVLDKKKIINKDIFQVDDTLENYIVVSLPLAESISRRHLYGVKLERAEVR